jgi:Peptidase family M28
MIRRFLAVVFLLYFFGCGRQNSSTTTQQETTPASTPTKTLLPYFNSTEAFSFLTAQTDFGPRNPGSEGHQKCLEYLDSVMKKNCDDVIDQQFTSEGYNNVTLHLTNLFASFQPKMSERILLLAHWDTRPRADMDKDSSNMNKPILGADDGASGVAVLLELAKILKSNPPPVGIDILFDDGEDYGTEHDLDKYSLGTRYFVKTKSPNYKPRFGVLLDMIGYSDLRIPMEQNSMKYAPEAVQLIWGAAEDLGITQFVDVPGEEIFDDHMPLNDAGIPTADIIDFDYPYWHTLQDTPDKCSATSLGAVGEVLTDVIYRKLAPRH